MDFINIAKKLGKWTLDIMEGMADKSAELKVKGKKRQEEVMVNKSDEELKEIATETSGINGYAARLELRDRGLL